MGVEPTRPLGHNLLKIARLPFRHASIFLYSGESTRRSGVTDGTRTRNRQDHNLSLYQLSYDHSSVTWTRTRNRPVNSRKLCQLSYYGLTHVYVTCYLSVLSQPYTKRRMRDLNPQEPKLSRLSKTMCLPFHQSSSRKVLDQPSAFLCQ